MFLVEALEDSISVQGRPNPSLQIRDGHSNCWLALAKLSESAVSYVGGEKHEKLKTTRKRRRSDDDDDDAETERKARQAGMGEEQRRKEGRKTNSAQNDRRTTIPREIVTSNASVTWRSRKQEKEVPAIWTGRVVRSPGRSLFRTPGVHTAHFKIGSVPEKRI